MNFQVTTANNQQLVPIARNISFRQCRSNEQVRNTKTNAQASFSISASSPTNNFISNNYNDSLFTDELGERDSPFKILKKKAKDVVEKKEVASMKYYGQSFNETLSASTERRLVVIMSWLEAKEKHIEKYRQFYLDRGFDVLNVKTSPLDLLLPKVGAKKISQDFVRFMVEKQYSNVLLHGFSVGGYMFGQILLDIDKQEEQVKQNLLNSIQGIVFDSLVPFEGTCIGVANSITNNKYAAKTIESLLRLYLLVGHRFATKYYLESSDKVWGGPLRCPTLFLQAKDDKISDYKIIERLENVWKGFGIETRTVLFDSAPHVQIFTKHQAEYVKNIEKFLKHIKMN